MQNEDEINKDENLNDRKSFYKNLWDECEKLRSNSGLRENEFCMPVMGIIFLKCMYVIFKNAEEKINKDRPSRNGITLPIEEDEFKELGLIMLPEKAQYDWFLSLPKDIFSSELLNIDGKIMNNLGEVLDNAMALIEDKTEQLNGILYKQYNSIPEDILRDLLKIFNKLEISKNEEMLIEISTYFSEKFNEFERGDEGIFFTPKSLLDMIVNILDPERGIVLDPACGSGAFLIALKKYMDKKQLNCHELMTLWGHEKIIHNARLCLMNIFINKLCAKIKFGTNANTYYNDPFNLRGKCDYVMCTPPFHEEKGIRIKDVENAGRLPFGIPTIKKDSIMNSHPFWISYFYSYLNEKGKAGFAISSSSLVGEENAEIRQKIVETKDIDLLINVPPKFFYSDKFKWDCCLFFFNKEKSWDLKEKVLFIDAINYFTPIEEGQNIWSKWQFKNLNAIVWLHKNQTNKYQKLLEEYKTTLNEFAQKYNFSVKNEEYFNSFKVEKEFFDLAVANKNSKISQQDIQKLNDFENVLLISKEYDWLISKFGKGIYRDILGLCKSVNIQEIKNNNYSLFPGIYVGQEKEKKENKTLFLQNMEKMHNELDYLENEAIKIMAEIRNNKKLWRGSF